MLLQRSSQPDLFTHVRLSTTFLLSPCNIHKVHRTFHIATRRPNPCTLSITTQNQMEANLVGMYKYSHLHPISLRVAMISLRVLFWEYLVEESKCGVPLCAPNKLWMNHRDSQVDQPQEQTNNKVLWRGPPRLHNACHPAVRKLLGIKRELTFAWKKYWSYNPWRTGVCLYGIHDNLYETPTIIEIIFPLFYEIISIYSTNPITRGSKNKVMWQ